MKNFFKIALEKIKTKRYIHYIFIIIIALLVSIPFLDMSLIGKLTTAIIILLLVYRHRENLKRVKNKTESKISWM